MDPNTTLAALMNAAFAGDADSVEILAENLTEWLRKNGFAPERKRVAQLVSLDDLEQAAIDLGIER